MTCPFHPRNWRDLGLIYRWHVMRRPLYCNEKRRAYYSLVQDM
jgi:hypothetical protein